MSEHRQGELFPEDLAPWEADAQSLTLVAHVVFAEAPHGPYSYRIPDAMAESLNRKLERMAYALGIRNLSAVDNSGDDEAR